MGKVNCQSYLTEEELNQKIKKNFHWRHCTAINLNKVLANELRHNTKGSKKDDRNKHDFQFPKIARHLSVKKLESKLEVMGSDYQENYYRNNKAVIEPHIAKKHDYYANQSQSIERRK